MKHGIILNDDFFSFCAKKIITENGRYSLLQFLNSNEMYEEKYFFVETGLPYLIKTANKLSVTEEFEEAYYLMDHGDISDPEFSKALRFIWMLAREDAGGCDNDISNI